MKKTIFCLLSSALMAFGFSACSSSDDFPEPTPSKKSSQLIRLTVTKGGVTRTSLNEQFSGTASPWLWSEGDYLVLSDDSGNYITTLTLDEGYAGEHEAVFSGKTDVDANPLSDGGDYRVTYIGSQGSLDTANNTFTVDFSKQDGSKGNTGLGTCDAMYADLKLYKEIKDHSELWPGEEVENDEVFRNASETSGYGHALELEKLLCVVHFQLEEDAAKQASVSQTALIGEGVYRSVTFKLGGYNPYGYEVADEDNPLIVGNGENGSIYLTMVPAEKESCAPIFRRKYGTGETATYDYGTPGINDRALVAGYIYRYAKYGESSKNGIPVKMKYNSLIEVYSNITVASWTRLDATNETTITFNPSNK